MEVPRPRIESKAQLRAVPQLWRCWIFNPLCHSGDSHDGMSLTNCLKQPVAAAPMLEEGIKKSHDVLALTLQGHLGQQGTGPSHGRMVQDTLTVRGIEVAQPTHIDIHIHQESALALLLKAGGSLVERLSHRPPKASTSYGQLTLGVTQVLLGATSCAVGALLYLGYGTDLRASGCAFWAGFAAIVAGAGAIVHEKHQGKLSGFVSGLLTLAGAATAVAAVVLYVNSLTREPDRLFNIGSMCDSLVPTTESPHGDSYSSWEEDRCRAHMKMVVDLFLGIRVLLLAVSVLQSLVALASLGLGLQSLCSPAPQALDEEGSEKLLGENSVPPSPSKETTTAVIVL
uniref:Transmembrane protein 176B n=2 Tax=Sus scrofa TaxID=9823 RepID=A0A8D0YVX1_PIG